MAAVLVYRLKNKGLMHSTKLRPVEMKFKPPLL
jgi:hypothetical protein